MPDLDMSPYAAFVWPAWAISALALGGLVARAVVASRRWKAELRRLEPTPPDAKGGARAHAAQPK